MSNGKWEAEEEEHVSASSGCGGIITTAEEINKFYESLFQNKLVRASTLQQMLPVKGKNKITNLNGYGFEFSDAILTLNFTRDKNDIARTLTTKQGESKDVFTREELNTTKETSAIVDEKTLSSYEGVYSASNFPMKVTIRREGQHLTAQATGQGAFVLDALNDREFKFDAAGILIAFKNDDTGKTTSMILTQGEEFELKRESGLSN